MFCHITHILVSYIGFESWLVKSNFNTIQTIMPMRRDCISAFLTHIPPKPDKVDHQLSFVVLFVRQSALIPGGAGALVNLN